MSCCTPQAEPYVFDITAFREAFAEFADSTAYPDARLVASNTMAQCYISPKGGKTLNGDCLTLAINLMTAHLLYLEGKIATGEATAMATSASVDKVSISLTPPPVKSQFNWWLSLSPRGAQLLALLKAKRGPFVFVASLPPERAAFRRAGGVFGLG